MLEIVESISGTFYYHLSKDGEVLCGNTYTMYTRLPIEAWGMVTHLKERYCSKCESMKEDKVTMKVWS